MIGGLGLPELIVIFLVILMLFGAKALPEVARGLAQAIKTFKKEAREIKNGFDVDDSTKSIPDGGETKLKSSDDFDPNAERPDWRPKSKT